MPTNAIRLDLDGDQMVFNVPLSFEAQIEPSFLDVFTHKSISIDFTPLKPRILFNSKSHGFLIFLIYWYKNIDRLKIVSTDIETMVGKFHVLLVPPSLSHVSMT